jgi:hypothetical protein
MTISSAMPLRASPGLHHPGTIGKDEAQDPQEDDGPQA